MIRKLIMFFFYLFNVSVFSQNIETVDEWEKKFLKNWDKEYSIAYVQSTSGDSWKFYNLAYSIDANNAMFQATGKTIYLDRALLYINNIQKSAIVSAKIKKSQFKDNYLGWPNHTAPSLGDDGKEYPLFESYCWRYITSLLYIIKKSPAIYSNKKYKSQFDSILAFTEKNIFDKWYSRGENNIYRSNVHMSSHWARISMDLYLITSKAKYKKVTDFFIDKFKNQIIVNPKNKNAISWKASWKEGKAQDVGHGNAVVSTVIDMYEKKTAFNNMDIDNLIITFDKVIWKSSYEFAERFDGSGNGSGWFTDGLIKLGRYSRALQRRLEKHDKGRSTQFYGNCALNSRILLAGKPVYPN
ncbi:hypothetical protein [Flavobacterium alkalisoli]|uniref:hypothetical protein n=1 Tax=Flavobacterium alkalisoli TaxID=2602769 RepID=UPI003A93F43D